jgi:acyl-CoA thioester hydrolase
MQIRVYYEDTDAGGIVYHSNYLNFCERARSEFFFQKGMLPVIEDRHFVVRKISCDFIKSAKFGDTIDVSTKLIEMKKASFSILHEIKKEDMLLFKSEVILVLVKDGKPQKLTPSIQNTLHSLFS